MLLYMKMRYIVLLLNVIPILKIVLSQCSGTPQTLTATVTPTEFLSPNYPSSYSNNLNCTWLIDSGTAGQPIMLYADSFYVSCSVGDYVNIYDGSSVTDTPLINNLCLNTQQTAEYISSDRHVLVQFVTDGSVVDTGFKMTYLSAADTSSTGCSTPTNLTASSSPSYLSSNGFPYTYQSTSSCRWLINAPGDLSRIHVQIEFSDIEYDSSCSYDKMIVYDGSYVCEHKVLFEYCSARTNVDTAHLTQLTYTSTSNSLLIIFTSDSHDNYHGFVLMYNATVAYTTTQVPTTTTTTTTTTTSNVKCTPCSSGMSVQQQQQTKSDTNVYLMVVSGLSGAVFVILCKAVYSLIRHLKGRKKPKKGLIRVKSIAPMPARTQHTTARISTNALSFV